MILLNIAVVWSWASWPHFRRR